MGTFLGDDLETMIEVVDGSVSGIGGDVPNILA